MKPYILLTPGPTPLPPAVLKAMSEPILHHRTAEFGNIFADVIQGLKEVYRTKGTVLMQTTSGTGGMEAAVANLISPGDETLVASIGVFGNRWAKILEAYGLKPVLMEAPWGEGLDPVRFEEEVKRRGKTLKAVFLTHTDTSTAGVCDVKGLAEIVRRHSDALVVVDSISGLGAQPLETDAWGLDAVVAASQKGLMNAPGLAFVSLSERALKAAEAAKLPRFYWDFRAYKKALPSGETPYTPAVSLVVAQKAALDQMRREGVENIWKRTRQLADHCRRELSRIGLKLFSKTPCDVLTAAELPAGTDGQALVQRILDKHRISIAGGQEKLKGKIIRVAHMGDISRTDLEAGLEAIREELAQPAER